MTTRPGTCPGGLSRRSQAKVDPPTIALAKVEAVACWHYSVAQGAMPGQVGLAFVIAASWMIRRRPRPPQ